MDVSSRAVLITGGASGIGRALAARFLEAGSDVIVCGRRQDKLREAQGLYPKLRIRTCDLAAEAERAALVEWAVREVPNLNTLVNNAGIQRRFSLADDLRWEPIRQELAINLEAPVHLAALLLPHLLKQRRPAIVNVGSGLAFVPLVAAPVYSATKAAIHSFTLSLRQALVKTAVEVVEIIPPAVNTDLGGPGLHAHDVPLDEFADVAFEGIRRGDPEISYGFSSQSSRASREQLDQIFARMNRTAG